MQIVSDCPKFILITGAPRSGTTIAAGILNSAENAVVLSEPNNAIRTHGFIYADKLGRPGEKREMEIGNLLPWLRSTGYLLTGVKEVCQTSKRHPNLGLLLEYALDEADLVLVTLRDPLEIYASQKAVLKFTLADSLVKIARFMEWTDAQKRRGRNVKFVWHDKLCADPLAALNTAAAESFRLEGEFAKLPLAGFGDARALDATEIKAPEPRRHLLSAGETAAIEEVAGEWFKKMEAKA